MTEIYDSVVSHQNRTGSETLPLCLLDLGRNSNPKARHTTKKIKNIKPSPDW